MKSNIIHLAIHKINPNATFQILDNDTDKITWTEGTTPIPVADIEAMIAQMPTAEEALGTISTPTTDEAAAKNIFDLSTVQLDSQDIVLNNFEITIARPLARVHHQGSGAAFKPFGYVQTGPYEVTGTLTVKRDDAIHDIKDHIKGDSAGIALSIAESSGFTISCPDVMIDNSKPEVSDFLLQSIPFRAFGATESASVISITIA